MRKATIIDDGGRYVLVRGNTRAALKDVPGMWSNRDRGRWIRRERLADVLARLELARIDADVIRGDAA